MSRSLSNSPIAHSSGFAKEASPATQGLSRSTKQFASWLGLRPDNRVSGGKVLSSQTGANQLGKPQPLRSVHRYESGAKVKVEQG